jgi:hypothetical protein
MPWKECKPMNERLKFVARLLDGEKMSALCRLTSPALCRRPINQKSRRPASTLPKRP